MNNEYLSSDELATLKALQAKAKRIQRAKKVDERFYRDADKRKYELLKRWGLSYSSTSDISPSDTLIDDDAEIVELDFTTDP
ncbi:MAG: hypothetical protein J5509_02860 [Lachnospiraceae bacterium]|nr:hypothetical protein [Lachnospiraceae bacterium]